MRRLTKGSVLAAFAAATLMVTVAAPTSAAPLGQFSTLATAGVTTGMAADSAPRAITTGPDGLEWFVDSDSVNRINADGTVTSFSAVSTFGANPSLHSIVTGPDGNLWFTKFNPPGQIGKITPSGTMTEVTSFTGGNVEDIIVGPDGNLWYTKPFNTPTGVIGRITTAGVSTEFTPPNDAPQPRAMTVGSDGNIWYSDDGGDPDHIGSILKSTPSGVITLVAQSGVTAGFGAGFTAPALTTGPDGNVWAVLNSSGGSAVARITPAGVVNEFADVNTGDLVDITQVCGSLFFSQQIEDESDPAIWKLTTAGVFTEFTAGLPAGSSPQGISAGADQDLKIAASGEPGRILNMGVGCAATQPVAPAVPIAVNPSLTG
jgi:virginiamycin B lyase